MNTINCIPNIYYRYIITKYTKPQTTENYIYSKKNKYVDTHQQLLNNKIEYNLYLENKQYKEKINKAWIISTDIKGRKYKYNTITKYSKWI